MKKSNLIKSGAVFLVAAVLGGGVYYTQKSDSASLSDIYQTHSVGIDNVSQRVTGTGNVEAKDKTSIYLDSAQTVSKVHVKVGDRVAAGDILVEYNTKQDMDDLKRRLAEAQIQMQNAQLNLENIKQPASGNELVQYNSDIATAQKNIVDAQNDLTTAQKNITDAQGDINSIEIKISQQQLKVDDAKTTHDNNKTLYESNVIAKKVYDDSVTVYKNALESLNDLILQKEIKEKALETRITQEEYAKQKLDSRIVQEEFAQQKLKNAQNKLSDESTAIQYNLQQNIISLNQITIDQITADMDKLTEKSISPIDGNIFSVNAVEGGIISKGVSAVTITDTSGIIVKFEVSEYDAPLIELGQKSYISTSALPDKIYEGTVTKIAEEAIEKEDSSDNEIVVPVEITIDNIDGKIKIGYSVDIEILIKEANGVLNIPIQALVFQEDQYYVYILKDNELEKVEISVGLYGDKTVEVIDGLNENDVIVLDPSEIG